MIKKIVLALLAVVAIYGAVLSPFSLTNTLEHKTQLEQTIKSRNEAKDGRDAARESYANAVAAFESQRSFDIHYTDLARMKQLIDTVTGISFSGLYEVDPNMNFALGAPLNPEDYPAGSTTLPPAVCMSVIAEDTAAGLRILDKLELPVYSITTSEPGRIDIIFMTGGEG